MNYSLKLGSIAALAGLTISEESRAQGLVVSTVSNGYSTSTCNKGTDLANANPDGDQFATSMASGSAGYVLSQRWKDASVWNTDFYDPQSGNFAGDNDDVFFDSPGTAISWFTGHGICNNGDADPVTGYQYCVTASQCTTPYSMSPIFSGQLPGFCKGSPGDTIGTCSYPTFGLMMALSSCTPAPTRQGRVLYGNSSYVMWGESPSAGGWRGSGTNGGTNLVVIHASCAELTNRPQELFAAYAGVHLIATTLVHNGDTAIISNRGVNFATEYLNNPFQSVSASWANAMHNNPAPALSSQYCYNLAFTGWNWGGGGSVSGGYGFNGCGAHAIMGMGATPQEAANHMSESWWDLKNDALDAKGASFYNHWYTCNWDCNTWPMVRP